MPDGKYHWMRQWNASRIAAWGMVLFVLVMWVRSGFTIDHLSVPLPHSRTVEFFSVNGTIFIGTARRLYVGSASRIFDCIDTLTEPDIFDSHPLTGGIRVRTAFQNFAIWLPYWLIAGVTVVVFWRIGLLFSKKSPSTEE